MKGWQISYLHASTLRLSAPEFIPSAVEGLSANGVLHQAAEDACSCAPTGLLPA